MTPKLTKPQLALLELYSIRPVILPEGHQVTPHRKLKRLDNL